MARRAPGGYKRRIILTCGFFLPFGCLVCLKECAFGLELIRSCQTKSSGIVGGLGHKCQLGTKSRPGAHSVRRFGDGLRSAPRFTFPASLCSMAWQSSLGQSVAARCGVPWAIVPPEGEIYILPSTVVLLALVINGAYDDRNTRVYSPTNSF
jgi:hypothetical protein